MTQVSIDDQMIDITGPEIVEVQIRDDGKVVWINIDGICRLRACQIKKLVYSPKPKEQE